MWPRSATPEEARRRIDQLQDSSSSCWRRSARTGAAGRRPTRSAKPAARRTRPGRAQAPAAAPAGRDREAHQRRERAAQEALHQPGHAGRGLRALLRRPAPRIEERGTRDFPEYQGRKLYGELTMNVTVDAAGRVVDAEIVRPSKSRVLDQRALAIVRAAGPFGAFTQAMRGRPTRSWSPRASASPAKTASKPRSAATADPMTPRIPVIATPSSATRWRTASPPSSTPALRSRPAEPVDYGRIDCVPDGFEAAVRALPPKAGAAATSPCPSSSRAAELARALTERASWPAQPTSCASTPSGWLADNTDGIGLLRDIEQGTPASRWPAAACCWSAPAAPRPACWGRCCWAAPAPAGGGANRSADKAHALVDRHAAWARAAAASTSAGARSRPGAASTSSSTPAPAACRRRRVPVPDSVLRPALAVDLMYGPAAGPFLDWAAVHGARAATAWACWSSRRPRPSSSGAACDPPPRRCCRPCASGWPQRHEAAGRRRPALLHVTALLALAGLSRCSCNFVPHASR
jgi:shikimate dehydrogenase